MVAKKKFQKEHLPIIVITIILIASIIINFSSAYYTDTNSVSSSSSLTFGTISVRAQLTGAEYDSNNGVYNISADEVALGNTLYKLVKIEPDTETQDFYMRVKLSAYNNNDITNLVTLSIAPAVDVTNSNYGSNYSNASTFNLSNWTAGNGDGKLYYNSSISLPTGTFKYIPVVIGFNGLGTDNFEDAYIKIDVEIIQSANNGYTGWSDYMPASGWPVSA